MNVLANALLGGVRRTKKNQNVVELTFYSILEKERKTGYFRTAYSHAGLWIVQYVNERNKLRLAIVNARTRIAVNEELIYVNKCKKGSAIACQCAKRVHAILLNERGETILNLGQRSRLMNQEFGKTENGEKITNRQLIRKLMGIKKS